MSGFLLAGLGNIGEEYKHSRHNIGFDVIDLFVARHQGSFASDRLADRAVLRIRGRKVTCIKPNTYMNLSGKAVKYWVDKEKLDLTALMVIYDELAIPLSRLKIRPLGGAGGHNGLKSIEALLGTQEYPRIRFGVGNDYPRGSQVDFVLGQFSPAEKNIVQKKMETCVLALEDFVLSGIESAMNRVNNLVFEG